MTAMTTKGTAKVTLPSDHEILVTREFNAPRHLVFRAWTTPELIKRWWSGGFGEVTVAEVDLRVGGAWRYALVGTDGVEVAFHGEFREIVPDERIVSTEVYEGVPGGEGTLNVTTFTETDGRTTVQLLVQAGDKETRDLIVDSGMDQGIQLSYDLLEEVAVSLA